MQMFKRYKAAVQPEPPPAMAQNMGEYTDLPQPQQGSQVGVGFPNLCTCQGVVCMMQNGSMIAAHIAADKDEAVMNAKMNELIQANGGTDAVKRMYVAYDKDLRQPEHGADMLEKAQQLGLPADCQVHFVDTSKQRVNGVQNGTFVQFSYIGRDSGRCLVEAKPNASMEYNHLGTKMLDDRAPRLDGTPSTKPGGVTVGAAVKEGEGDMNHVSHKGPDRIIRMK